MLSLSLPPIVVLLLLAFLWLILLVLLVWFAFGRRDPDELTEIDEPRDNPRDSRPRKTRRRAQRDGLEATLKPDTSRAQANPRPPTVRVVKPAEPKAKSDLQDAFDDFNQPEHRRDELDF